MADERVVYIKRRRSAVKGEITKLRTAISRNEFDLLNVRLRFKRISDLFHQFEELNLELDMLETTDVALEANTQQFEDLQNSFYDLNTIVELMPNAGGSRINAGNVSGAATGFGNSTFTERQKSVKLPIANLPKFDGKFEEWISFRNEFKSMIDARTDIDDVNKFIYLRNSLSGSASKKLALLDATAENYERGWGILTDLYEKKRLIITSHYNSILELAKPMQTTSVDLISKLIDDAQQHLATLKQLGVVPDEGMIVCCLERALPIDVREDWEKTLKSNVMPDFKGFYTFLSDYVDRAHNLNKQLIGSRGGQSRKSHRDQEFQNAKARKSNSGARTLVTNTTGTCAHCKGTHRTFQCTEFEGLSTQQRWDSIRSSGACRNCLHFHKDTCNSSHCKKCGKPHHTLLDADKRKPVNKDALNHKAVKGEERITANSSIKSD